MKWAEATHNLSVAMYMKQAILNCVHYLNSLICSKKFWEIIFAIGCQTSVIKEVVGVELWKINPWGKNKVSGVKIEDQSLFFSVKWSLESYCLSAKLKWLNWLGLKFWAKS